MQGRFHLDPGAFVEALFPYVVQFLNNVLEKTPLEQPPNVSLIPADTLPPAPDPRNPHVWDEWVRTSVRWQLCFLRRVLRKRAILRVTGEKSLSDPVRPSRATSLGGQLGNRRVATAS